MTVYPREDRRILRALRLCAATPDDAAIVPSAWPLPGIESTGFRMLARHAEQAGLNIMPPDSHFVSEDEAALVSLLTPHQRQESPAAATPGIAETANAAREAMRRRERSRQSTRGRPRTTIRGDARPGTGAAIDAVIAAEGLPHDLRARVIELARWQAVVSTTEFGRIGVSRQYLHALRKTGVIESAGYGRYRLPG